MSEIKSSSDWTDLQCTLRYNARNVTNPQDARKMVDTIGLKVRLLGNAEIECKRHARKDDLRTRDLVKEINEMIAVYEQWLVFAILCQPTPKR